MRKWGISALTLLIVAGTTVALLAALSPQRAKCALVASSARGNRFTTLVPPGNSSGSQYVENVPTARGNCPDAGLAARGRGSGGIPRSTERALLAAGTDGAATAALARATRPVGSGIAAPGLPAASGGQGASAAPSGEGSAGGGSSSLQAIADTLAGSSGGGGLGALFPLILVGCLLVVFGIVFLRVRQRPH